MLNEYLEFAKYQKNEETETVRLNDVINDVVKKYENKQINITVEENLEIKARPNSIKRCLVNLIDNGLSYGKKVNVLTKKNA